MRKFILILILCLIIILMGTACEHDNHEGKVVDKTYEEQADTYMDIGNGVLIPILGGTDYYVVIENARGDRERVALKRKVFDQFDKGDNFENEDNKVYKNGELIDE